MNKSTMKKEIQDMLIKITRNKFLFPEWHSRTEVQLSSRDESYTTYMWTRDLYSLYANIYIRIWNKILYEILIRRDSFGINCDDIENQPTIKEIHDIVLSIYEEMFSFKDENKDEEKRNIRTQISKQNDIIQEANKEIKRLNGMLSDIDTL